MAGTKRMNHRRRRTVALAVLGALALLAAGARAHAADETGGRIERIDIKTEGSSTKVMVMLSRPIAFDVHVLGSDAAKKLGRRLLLDFANTTIASEAAKPIEVANERVGQVRTGQFNAKTARLVLELVGDTTHAVEAFESPPHVTITLAGATAQGAPSVGTPSAGASEPSQPAADTGAAVAPNPSTATPGSDATHSPPKTIPLRARGRRPYSLIY